MAMRRWNGRFPSEMDDGSHYTFYYEIESSLNYNRRRIEEAMTEIESHSRIRFEPRRHQQCYLTLMKSDGCWTTGTGDDCGPRISLGLGCREFGTILHELLHAIGFEHEHCRPDRSKFITINWRNIKDGAEDQFKIPRRNPYYWEELDMDYESIMIYDSYAYTRNGEMTIERKDGGVIERNNELSDMDKDKLSEL